MQNALYNEIKTWMYRNARHVELCLWQYFFEDGDKKAVADALLSYQNEDGGFGHVLEPDNWNPNSTPTSTDHALGLLRLVGFEDMEHPVYQGIWKYLEAGKDLADYGWRFTVESNYTEILDAGYVPKLTATTLNADNTTSTKVLYDPDNDTFAELNRYLHMRFYKQTEGKDGKKKEYTTYAYTTAYPNKDYMGLVVSNLAFYARGWKEEKETGKICLTSLSMQLTVAKPDGTPVYTQTAVIPLPGAPEFQ